MGSKHGNRLRISNLPARLGLATAGHQIAIDERALWQALNYTADLDGFMSKRPGLAQYGQTIMGPNKDATGTSARASPHRQGTCAVTTPRSVAGTSEE